MSGLSKNKLGMGRGVIAFCTDDFGATGFGATGFGAPAASTGATITPAANIANIGTVNERIDIDIADP